jgi:prepilin-type N-terminal cleavage/methylation domain-containing protein
MLHTFTKKGLRGFTLIELLVVIAIIGLLSTVIAAPITEARKKGRDSKKISDVRSLVTALSLYADDNAGVYPDALDGLVPRYLPNLPSAATASTINRDKYMYVTYVEGGRNVAYHLGTKLESGNQGLNDDADCGGSGTALTGNVACVGTSAEVNKLPACTTACTVQNSNWSASAVGAGSPAATAATTDFGSGTDTGTTTCTSALNTCIYDLVN